MLFQQLDGLDLVRVLGEFQGGPAVGCREVEVGAEPDGQVQEVAGAPGSGYHQYGYSLGEGSIDGNNILLSFFLMLLEFGIFL